MVVEQVVFYIEFGFVVYGVEFVDLGMFVGCGSMLQLFCFGCFDFGGCCFQQCLNGGDDSCFWSCGWQFGVCLFVEIEEVVWVIGFGFGVDG